MTGADEAQLKVALLQATYPEAAHVIVCAMRVVMSFRSPKGSPEYESGAQVLRDLGQSVDAFDNWVGVGACDNPECARCRKADSPQPG